jgi:hypothetical protein
MHSRFPRQIVCIFLVLLAFFPQISHALSPLSFTKGISVFFSKNSYTLSDSDKVRLARRLPDIRAGNLQIIYIVLSSTRPLSDRAADNKSNLDAKRIKSIRKFFIDAGVPEQKIVSEVREVNSEVASQLPPGQIVDGEVNIEYFINCFYGNGGLCGE